MTGVHASHIGPDFVPLRAPSTHTVELDGEAILLDEARNRLHLLNTTATLVWSFCDGSNTLGDIARDLAEVVEMPTARVSDELVALARKLAAEGLLDGVEPDPNGHGVVVDEIRAS